MIARCARLLAFFVIATAGILQGCGESVPAPDETAKNAPPAPPKKIQDIAKKKGGLIPKSIKERG